MKKWQNITGIAVVMTTLVLFAEIHGIFMTRFLYPTVSFHELPKEVQDTVSYWIENKDKSCRFTNSDSLIKVGIGTPIVISFDGKYTLENEKFGPWVKYRVLTRISDGKEYRLSRTTDVPLIVRNDTLLIPDNILYNLNIHTKFRIRKLR